MTRRSETGHGPGSGRHDEGRAPRGTGALVLGAVELKRAGVAGGTFVRRRAEAEVARLGATAERRILAKLLAVVAEPAAAGGELVAKLLGAYAAELERGGRYVEAAAALELALRERPESAELALRAARVARLRGRAEGAAGWYARVRELDDGSGRWSRLAAIGEALIGEEPMRSVSRAMRAAVRAGDAGAAAIALEERAGLRQARGEAAGAIRDLCVAALRYESTGDRARVAHRLADVLAARGDHAGTREALLAALAVGKADQRAYAVNRLHTLARAAGDELGLRRWRSSSPSPLVALGPGRRAAGGSAAGRLRRWRGRLEAARSA